MSDGIYSALSGAIAQERNLTVVANNVANVNTTGYKGDKTIFAEALNKAKTNSPLPAQTSLKYAMVDRLSMDNTAGSLKQTGRPLDVALQGDAYFTLETTGGDRYTRAGSFVLDRDGVMRTTDGFAVVKEVPVDQAKTMSRKMIIPQDTREIQINPDGTVNADGVQVGKMQLAHFDNQDQLTRDGLTRFAAKDGVTPKSAAPTVTTEQGYLEAANVNAIAGMNELIIVNRSFEALQKVIDTFHDLDDRTARDVAGKV
jgi:flagellar basal-body rod protein FlgF